MREKRNRIIKQLRSGNCDVFRKLVQKYQQPVYQFCYTILGNKEKAGALANETFLCLYRKRENFVASRKLEVWLYQTAMKLAQCGMGEEASSNGLIVTRGNVLNDCIKQQSVDIQFLLMNLSVKQRLALVLKSSNHLSIQEISEVLDTPTSEIPAYIWQGRETLRKKLHEFSS